MYKPSDNIQIYRNNRRQRHRTRGISTICRYDQQSAVRHHRRYCCRVSLFFASTASSQYRRRSCSTCSICQYKFNSKHKISARPIMLFRSTPSVGRSLYLYSIPLTIAMAPDGLYQELESCCRGAQGAFAADAWWFKGAPTIFFIIF